MFGKKSTVDVAQEDESKVISDNEQKKHSSEKKVKPRKKQKELTDDQKLIRAREEMKECGLFGESRKTLKSMIAASGVNPNPLDHMEIDDCGTKVYSVSMYIEKMPGNATFASTFTPLFNFESVTTSVFINPLIAGASNRLIDKRVLKLDSERVAAENDGDRNRHRKTTNKLAEAEGWATDIEKGDNKLFEVTFLFNLRHTNKEKLELMISDFRSKGREKGFELSACYGCHPEALLSGGPTNRIFRASSGIVKTTTAKKHIMDKYSLATIFNHTKANFSHKNGIVVGHDMMTQQPTIFDIYDPSLNGYNLLIAGKTGTGKSATVKMWLSRYADFDFQIASVDVDARGNRGEYSIMAENLGGVSYLIKPNSPVILNLYELNEEDEYDETTGKEYKVLRLNDKLRNLLNIKMSMIKSGKANPEFKYESAMEKIINTANANLYESRGIFDNDVDSLYESGTVFLDGKLSAGRRKKQLPTLHNFFVEVLHMQKENKNPYHEEVYNIIIDTVSDFVKEVNYCPDCLHEFTHDVVKIMKKEKLEQDKGGRPKIICPHCEAQSAIVSVKGTRAYFDGLSTVSPSVDLVHVNVDVSQLPDADKPIAQQICTDYLNENFVKRNSMNPKKVRNLVFLMDELHRTFPYEPARKLIADQYRTNRKRHVSTWALTQALKDCNAYEETRSIIKNSAAILLLKQDFNDKSYLENETVLTPAQVERVLSLGGDPNESSGDDPNVKSDAHKGECCLICNDRVVFVKVDYLKASESYIVETEVGKINQLHAS